MAKERGRGEDREVEVVVAQSMDEATKYQPSLRNKVQTKDMLYVHSLFFFLGCAV